MSVKWVMTERKVIRVKRAIAGSHHPATVEHVDRVFDVGAEAPEGHEGRPYTRKTETPDTAPVGDARQEPPAQDRMDRGRGSKNRKG